MHDPIADMLTRLRNGNRALHRFVDIDWSKMKEAIVKILKEKGFVAHYLVKEEKKKKRVRVFLRYTPDRKPLIQGIKRVSKPSLRCYTAVQKIPTIRGGMGITILSTSEGVMEGALAREKKIGGELLCVAW